MFWAFDEKLFPELLLFPEGDVRRGALSAARRANRPVVFALCAVVTVAVVFACWVSLSFAVFEMLHTHEAFRTVIGVGLGSTLGGFCLLPANWLWRRRVRRTLRALLQQRGVPICITCGYDLRGLREGRCPECGCSFNSSLSR